MEIEHVPCLVCAVLEDTHIVELRLEHCGQKSVLGNIYVGQVENISPNIGAAFVQTAPG